MDSESEEEIEETTTEKGGDEAGDAKSGSNLSGVGFSGAGAFDAVTKLEGQDADIFAVSLSAMILDDDDMAVTTERMESLTKAAGLKVQGIWFSLYGDLFKNNKVSDLIMSSSAAVGGGGGAAPAGGAPAAGGDDAPAEEAAKEAEEESSSDDAGVGGMFDSDSDSD